MDVDVENKVNFIVGANESDYHLINVNIEDFKPSIIADVKNIIEGDVCPNCGKGKVYFTKGIEIGNTFKLGTKYSEKLDLNYLDKDNKLNPVWMGCYGLGIGRNIAAIIEQNHDDKGIIWPLVVAPYKVAIVLIDKNNEAQSTYAEELYSNLESNHIDTIIDDRDERAGVKFADMDLIGIPLRVTVGKKISDGIVEIKNRRTGEVIDCKVDEVQNFINEFIKNNK